ncbi:MAG: cytochrome c oxidase subunit 3 [Chitinophagales bacterium]|nr:cytochrome c oxidase subunit 3 [Chitinophagales bacterium]
MQASVRHKRYIVHPYKFNLWLAIMAIVMMFAAFTSAYIVQRHDINNWILIQLPQMFTYSTIVIIASSISMQLSYVMFKRNRIDLYRLCITITCLLGALFLVLQINGWQQLVQSGILLSGNVAGSFVFVISGAHFLHVAGGVVALIIFSVRAFTMYKTPEDTLLLNIHPDQQTGVELMATYWHFVGFLWIYLFIFFNVN